VVPNAAGNAVVQLEQMTGTDIFSGLSPQAKAEAMPLLEPKPHERRRSRAERRHER
jgi:hypothetical protein